MKKKIILMLLSVVLVASMGLGAKTINEWVQVVIARNVKVSLNGEAQTLRAGTGEEIHPIIYDGSSYLPVRAIANLAGLNVDWDAESSTVLLGTDVEPWKDGIDVDELIEKIEQLQQEKDTLKSNHEKEVSRLEKTIEEFKEENTGLVNKQGEEETKNEIVNEEIKQDLDNVQYLDKFILNGKEVETDVNPHVLNNEVYLPVRTLGESLDLHVNWNAEKRQISFSSGNDLLLMTLDKKEYIFNNKTYSMKNVAPIVASGRTLVPARYIVETFGGEIKVDMINKSVSINYNKQEESKTQNTPTHDTTPDSNDVGDLDEEYSYLEINKPYVATSGLEVVVNSINKTETEGVYIYKINYTLRNVSADKKIDEGTFKMHIENENPLPQYGFFGTLFPYESISREYEFKLLKSQKPHMIEYDASFFSNSPEKDTLKWEVKN